MNFSQRCVTSFLFLSIGITLQAQSSLSGSIRDEIKKDLLKQIKPTSLPPSSFRQQSTLGKAIQDDDLSEFAKKYQKKTGGAEFEDKYQLGEGLKNLRSNIPLNKLPDGHVTPVFNNGRWEFMNTANRVDGLVTPSGLNLSGGGAKKLSEKSKNILINVFGIEVDESPIIITKELIEKVSIRPPKK